MSCDAPAETLAELRRQTARLTHARRRGDSDAQAAALTELTRVRILRGEFDKADALCADAAQLAEPGAAAVMLENLAAALAHFRTGESGAPTAERLAEFLTARQAAPGPDAPNAATSPLPLSSPVPIRPESESADPGPSGDDGSGADDGESRRIDSPGDELVGLRDQVRTLAAEHRTRLAELDARIEQVHQGEGDRVAEFDQQFQATVDHVARRLQELADDQTELREQVARLEQAAAEAPDRPAIDEAAVSELRTRVDRLAGQLDRQGQELLAEMRSEFQVQLAVAGRELHTQGQSRDGEIAALIQQQLRFSHELDAMRTAESARPSRARTHPELLWALAIGGAVLGLVSLVVTLAR